MSHWAVFRGYLREIGVEEAASETWSITIKYLKSTVPGILLKTHELKVGIKSSRSCKAVETRQA